MGEKHGTELGRCAAVLITNCNCGRKPCGCAKPGKQCRKKAIGKRDVHKNAAREVEFLTGFIYER